MARLLLVFMMLMSSSVMGTEDRMGQFGLGIGDNGNVTLYFFISNDINLHYGYNFMNSTTSGSLSSNFSSVSNTHLIGIRKHFSYSDANSRFIDLEATVSDVKHSQSSNEENSNQLGLNLYTGIEYYLVNNVSIEAKLGIGYSQTKYGTYDVTEIDFPKTQLGMNYEF